VSHAGTGAAPSSTGGRDAAPEADAAPRANEGPGARRADYVQSLERGLAVIKAFGPERSRLTLTEVAQATGLARAVARRFLLTLAELGYVRTDGREFSLRPRVLELGYAYLSGLTLTEIAQPFVEELVATVHESSSISVLDGRDVVYVVRVPTTRIMTVAISIGTRFPAYCTSMGRVLLAGKPEAELEGYLTEVELVPRTKRTVTDAAELRGVLEDVRAQGYALVKQELEDGLVSIAVPIRDRVGAVVAAMNVSANAMRVDPDTLVTDVLPRMREAAAHIEEGLRAHRVATRHR
jgi:IclR family transcriptional regulator, pca regulon regulatory protein